MNNDDYNKDFSNYAYIIDSEEIVSCTECSNVEFVESHPEIYTPEHVAKKGTYLGRGYRYNHNYLGELSGGELCDFWKK